MDKSPEYIMMCEKAEEIQTIKADKFENGDFMKWFGVSIYDERLNDGRDGPKTYGTSKDIVWIPRMDQLAEMIETWNKKYSTAFFQNIVANSVYRNISVNGYDSIEKHLLAFVMSEKYDKRWVNGEWLSNKSANK